MGLLLQWLPFISIKQFYNFIQILFSIKVIKVSNIIFTQTYFSPRRQKIWDIIQILSLCSWPKSFLESITWISLLNLPLFMFLKLLGSWRKIPGPMICSFCTWLLELLSILEMKFQILLQTYWDGISRDVFLPSVPSVNSLISGDCNI